MNVSLILQFEKWWNLLILNQDADPRLQPEALGLAAWDGKTGFVKQLVNHGWDVNSKAFKGRTPLHHARNRKHRSIVKLLTAAGARS